MKGVTSNLGRSATKARLGLEFDHELEFALEFELEFALEFEYEFESDSSRLR